MITIRERPVAVDVERELLKYDWKEKRMIGRKLNSCSPFRDERRPSFAVHLDTGAWVDKGSTDPSWTKGSFVRLLAFLRHEQQEETEDFLLSVYAPDLSDVDSLSLDFNLAADTDPDPDVRLPSSLLTPFLFRHPYLERRGISEEVQRLFQIGYDRARKGISIPWFHRSGELANIKFRSVTDKRFWYLSGGDRIRKHVFGLNIIVAQRIRRVYVTEAEIDSLYLWTHGLPAVALGGAHLSDRQRSLLLGSGIEDLMIATDNDGAGDMIAEQLNNKLAGYMNVQRIQLPAGVKDVNEIPAAQLAAAMNIMKRDSLTFL